MGGSKTHPVLLQLRGLSAALPETTEVLAWGHPTFRVRNKIFASFGFYRGITTVSCKQTKFDQLALVADPRIDVAKYVGQHGWITLRADECPWPLIASLVERSYRLIAPRKLAAQLPADDE